MTQDYVDDALLALRKGDFASARASMQKRSPHIPREVQHYLIEGLACLAMADWQVARDLFAAATDAHPDHAQFWFNRGLAEENLGTLSEAETSYQHSLSLKPNQGEIFGNLSNIYRRLGRFPEAVQMACRAVAADLPKPQALNLLGLALGKQGNFSEAGKAFDEAIALSIPDAALFANRANLAVDQLKFDQAWGFFAQARAISDSAVIRRDEGMARMLGGDYAGGLPLYEARLELPNALRLQPSCPRWNGESLSGKTLLLLSEQGFGDTIQFSLQAKALTETGAHLIWVIRQPLQKLFAANLPGQIVVEGDALPAADFWLPILSLPFALGMTSPQAPQLRFKAPAMPQLPDDKGKRKIGLVWSGSRTHERDHERSIAIAILAQLWDKVDGQFYAPFKGGEASLSTSVIPAKAGIQMQTPPKLRRNLVDPPLPTVSLDSGLRQKDTLRVNDDHTQIPITSLDHLITDFADQAALLSQLDCLVTVDTAAAHLAGALGVRTFVLLPYCPDWRWGTSSETTPWYPNMMLLRQSHYGDWDSVVQHLLQKLA